MTDDTVRERIARGVAAFDREAFEEALALFDEVARTQSGFPDVQNKRGLCLAMMGRAEDALDAFEEAVRLAPDYAEAHLNRGILLQELGRHEEAQEALHHASDLDHGGKPEFPSHVGNEIAIGHAKLGDLYLVAEHAAASAREYARALEVRPGYLDIRTKYAEALIELGELDRAAEELRFVLDRNDRFAAARLRYGVVLHRTGDTEGAIEAWERCMRDAPGDMRARAYLASVGVRPGHGEADHEDVAVQTSSDE
ncbi:MAG TPA: tetratricopeptide repeat protein [Myxococcota bacterium]|nr:tetratricopeptide repeat protein [Myxococcota bacterium]HKK94036.1 tetratricopeptide repeat protein [Longimicrobiales bacterium]